MAIESVAPQPDLLNFRVSCSWCGRHLKGDPASPLVSHTICPPCEAEYRAANGLPAKPCSTQAEEGRRSPALAGTRSLAGLRGAAEGGGLPGELVTDRRRESGEPEAGVVRKPSAHPSVAGSPAPSPARALAGTARPEPFGAGGRPVVLLGGVA